MFTGIITDIGTVRSAKMRGDLRLVIGCTNDLSTVDLGAWIACSGACLTVVDKGARLVRGRCQRRKACRTPRLPAGPKAPGSTSNARCASATSLAAISSPAMSTAVGEVVDVRPEGGSTRLGARGARRRLAAVIAAKGSITLDGVSLTVNKVTDAAGLDRFHGQSHPAYRGAQHARRTRRRATGSISKST